MNAYHLPGPVVPGSLYVLTLRVLVDASSRAMRSEAELKRQGIRDTMEVFAKPFYPLVKRKIMQSWGRVFDIDGVDEQYLQGAVWCIKKEWIQRI